MASSQGKPDVSSKVSPVAVAVKKPPATAGDTRDVGSIPGSGGSPQKGMPTPVFFLKNPMDRGAWRASVDRVAELDMTEAT